MENRVIGKVLSIAFRTRAKGPMKEVPRIEAVENAGLVGDVPGSAERGVTLLASGQWEAVVRELGRDIPWHTRRANVFIEAESLAHLIGQEIAIGPIHVSVIAETRPCGYMDQLEPGLKDVLKPDCRAGVYGRIMRGGTIQVGDSVALRKKNPV